MELNAYTVKKGMELFILQATHYKDEKIWYFTIRKVKAESLDAEDSFFYFYGRRQVNTSDELPYNYHDGYHVYGDVRNNKEPFLKIRHDNEMYTQDIIYLCDSYKTTLKTLKQAVFNGKGNETTRRKRLSMYRAFMVAYNKAPYKENFYTAIR